MAISIHKFNDGWEVCQGESRFFVDLVGNVWEEKIDYAMGRPWLYQEKASKIQVRRVYLIIGNLPDKIWSSKV